MLKNILVSFGLGLFLIIFWTWISSPLILTVEGTGEVSVPATSATLSFSLTTADANPQAAILAVKAKADALAVILRANGIAQKDIVESQVTAYPATVVVQGASGYQASISMAAKTSKVASVNELISVLYANGAAVVTQPILSVENQTDLEQKAFDAAYTDASIQAAKIAIKNWKLFRKTVNIAQASSGTTSTSSSKDTANKNGVFKIAKVVSVSYKMW